MIANRMRIETGNLDELNEANPAMRSWIVGSFVPDTSLLHSESCEVKWAKHPKGLKKTTGMDLSSDIRTVMILISGSWRTWIPEENREVILSVPGQYLAYDTGAHECEALEDSHLVIIRWKQM